MRLVRYLALLAVALALPMLAGCHERERTVIVHNDRPRRVVIERGRHTPDRFYYYDHPGDRGGPGGPRDGDRGGPPGGGRGPRSRRDRPALRDAARQGFIIHHSSFIIFVAPWRAVSAGGWTGARSGWLGRRSFPPRYRRDDSEERACLRARTGRSAVGGIAAKEQMPGPGGPALGPAGGQVEPAPIPRVRVSPPASPRRQCM
jgi:hypothetical protein